MFLRQLADNRQASTLVFYDQLESIVADLGMTDQGSIFLNEMVAGWIMPQGAIFFEGDHDGRVFFTRATIGPACSPVIRDAVWLDAQHPRVRDLLLGQGMAQFPMVSFDEYIGYSQLDFRQFAGADEVTGGFYEQLNAQAFDDIQPWLDRFAAAHPRPARVLIPGCGRAWLCGKIEALGHEAYGIDIDPAYAAQWDAMGLVHNRTGDLFAEIASFDDGLFDAVVLLGFSTYRVSTFTQTRVLLDQLRRCLRPANSGPVPAFFLWSGVTLPAVPMPEVFGIERDLLNGFTLTRRSGWVAMPGKTNTGICRDSFMVEGKVAVHYYLGLRTD